MKFKESIPIIMFIVLTTVTISLTTIYSSSLQITLAIIILLILGLGGVFYIILRNKEKKISKYSDFLQTEKERYSNLSSFVESISKGDYTNHIDIDTTNDELGSKLVQMREQLQTSSEEDKKRNWSNTGLAKFEEILRSSKSMEVLADSIISNVVKYLKANQGSLFVVESDNEDEYLELKATYAYERKKFIEKKIELGQGLTGQCWIEGDTILLTDIPQSYLNITSGLGHALPKSILLVPLKLDDKVYGVVEMASFKVFQQHEIDFLEKLAESIAATISTAKINSTTKVLLEETQQQAEELRAQEEEVRQNMEELQATQEEMERVSSEMSEQLRVINATLATIEFDLQGNISDANDNFLSLMGYNKEEIRGRHHRIFVESIEAESDNYKAFWSKLASGQYFDGEFKRITKKGKTVWIKGMYSPVLNSAGEPVKVVKFAYDITELKIQQTEISEQLRVINSTVATIEFDLKGNIQNANDNFLSLMGYDKSEIVSRHHRIFVEDSEAKSDEYKIFWNKLASGQSFEGEFRRLTKTGDFVWIKGMYSSVFDNAGQPVKVVKFAYDITASKRQETEMTTQLNVINSTMATIEFDALGNIRNANDNFLSLMGYKREEIIGEHHRIFVDNEEKESDEYKNFWMQLGAGESFNDEFRRITKNGKEVWIKGMYSPVSDNYGNIVKVVKFAYDITIEKQQALELEKIKSQLVLK